MSAPADSLFSLGPIVAAQHVSVPLVSERSGDLGMKGRNGWDLLFIVVSIYLIKVNFT
jgi:hypothetical protein